MNLASPPELVDRNMVALCQLTAGQYSMVLQERFELSRVSPTDPKSVVSAISPLEHVAEDNGIEPLSSVLETEVLPLN